MNRKDLHGGTYTTRSNWRRWSRDSLKTDQVNLVAKITNLLPDVQLKEVRKQFKHVMRLPLRDLKIALPLSLLTF
jgi:hypothetical protein